MNQTGVDFYKIFQNNIVGFILTDKHHIITQVNDHLLKLTGLQKEQVIGKTLLELGIIDAKFVKNIWKEMASNGILLDKELTFRNSSGKEVYALFSIEKIELNNEELWFTTILDISKRRKTEKELSDIYERVTDAFVAINPNWQYTYVNQKAGELLDKDPAYLVGKNIWAEFPEDIGQPVYLAYHEALEKQTMISMEEYYQPKNRWFQNLIYPSPDGLSVFFSDITEKKKIEKEIADSELRFRHLARTAPVGIFETDANGLTTYVNETWMTFTGLLFDEAIGNGWLVAVHPDDKEELVKIWQQKAKEKELSISEYRMIDKTGRMRWVSGKAIPIVNPGGSISGYIGTVTDITETKLAIELLKKSEETLHRAQNMSKTGNWEFVFASGELNWSRELYRIFELEGHPKEGLYEAYRGKFHPDDLAELDSIVGHSILNATGYQYEHRIICKDGTIKHILGIGEVVADGNGMVVGLKGTAQDITERKLTEEKLTERTLQLRELGVHLQNVREDERRSIAREIHDELGQQLTGLKMDIAWLMKKSNQEEEAIKNKFNDTLVLVDNTVKSIRRISTELRPSIIDDLGLNAALEWLLSEFSTRLNIQIKFEKEFDDKTIGPDIAIGLFRILQESLNNIAKHANAKTAHVSIKKTEQQVCLAIHDDGVGFEPSDKKKSQSFGLLGITERTHMMGGNCTIYSKPAGGTKIEIIVPIV